MALLISSYELTVRATTLLMIWTASVIRMEFLTIPLSLPLLMQTLSLPVSPLAQAQANQDISSVARFLELVGGVFGPEMLQVLIDSEQTAVHLAKKFGVPESLIRDEEQRKQIAALAQQMAQQQGMMPSGQQG